MFNFKDEIGLLPLIAMSKAGYKKIVQLSSKSYLNNKGKFEPLCEIEDLLEDHEGVILLSGSVNGLIGKLFNKGKLSEIEEIYKIFSKNY